MKHLYILPPSLALLLMIAGPHTASAQTEPDTLRLNSEAVRMIQFDFSPHPTVSPLTEKPRTATLDKPWMNFKTIKGIPRRMTDSVTVKKPEDYIRAEPYTIWTAFGEDPVYDMLPVIHKQWKIHWTLNLNPKAGEYGRSILPIPGMDDPCTLHLGGAVLTFDADKLLFETLTRRGRMLKHNRKHANAWKIYATYIPTAADSAKFPSYRLIPLPVSPARTDTAHDSIAAPAIPSDTLKHPVPATADSLSVSNLSRYIRQQEKRDSIRHREWMKHDKGPVNPYDIGRRIRQLHERSN